MIRHAAYPLVVAVIATGSPAVAAGWGAVAVHEPTGGYWFGLDDSPARKGPQWAARHAVEMCYEATDGSNDCRIAGATHECIALVRAGGAFFADDGETAEAAGEAALAVCEAKSDQTCVLERTFCVEQ
ncbi:MAG: DUF4189 domain-containing protein [Pseudomonadota bacterium]